MPVVVTEIVSAERDGYLLHNYVFQAVANAVRVFAKTFVTTDLAIIEAFEPQERCDCKVADG